MLVRVLFVCLLVAVTTEANQCCLSPDIGRGSDPRVRFYYDSDSGMCEQFVYKGVGGNENRFEALEQCLEACHDVECSV